MLSGVPQLTEIQAHEFKSKYIVPYLDMIVSIIEDDKVKDVALTFKKLIDLVKQKSNTYDPSQRALVIEEDTPINDIFLYSAIDALLPAELAEHVEEIYTPLFKLLHETRWNKNPGSKSIDRLNSITAATAQNDETLFSQYQQVTPNVAIRLSALGKKLDTAMIENDFLIIIETAFEERLAKMKGGAELLKLKSAQPVSKEPAVSSSEPKQASKPAASDPDALFDALLQSQAESMSDDALALFLQTYTPAQEAKRQRMAEQEERDVMLAIEVAEKEEEKSKQANPSL